ncbi:hypothetical protein [Sphingobium sp. YR657]|uniref:hypothetical protein n=1 Tax=Sphingobium sp. YR657 TaxID=1884366 RepID=UPI0031377C7E
MDATYFRKALVKIMPGYDWTVHRARKGVTTIVATGIQTSGLNRLSTLEVTYAPDDKGDWFRARSAGYGRRAPWLYENGDATLARALRGLQDYYRHTEGIYRGHAAALEAGRKVAPDAPAPRADSAGLLEALTAIVGSLNVASDNPNVPDDFLVPVDITMGELRKARAAIASAKGEAA